MRLLTVISAALLGTSFLGMPAAATQPLSFGVVPQQSASRLARIWVPFINEVGQRSGVPLRFATAKDIPTFESCLASGSFDIAYMNPLHYIVFHDSAGYVALARQSGKQLKGILVVRRDSKVKTLADLAGQQLAFPSPAAFGASVLPRAELNGQRIRFEPVYVKSHDSVYRAVADGHFLAGGGVLRTWRSVAAPIRDQLRIFYSTAAYSPHAFAANLDVASDTRQRIAIAMSEIADDKPQILKALGMEGIRLAGDSEWDDIRRLNDISGVVNSDESTCRSK